MQLTELQRRALNVLIAAAVNGEARVSLTELTKALGLSAPSGALHYIRILCAKGYIQTITPKRKEEGNSYKILKTK